VRAADVSSLPSFEGNTGWLNTKALSPEDLRGKVVLVDFWEYTCVNCLRTLPYLREWYRRYRGMGFTIVAVHSPEFGFSGSSQNVTNAAKHLGIEYPIALDSNHSVWNRFGNRSWPHEYLFDRDGKLVEDYAGEGRYPETEATIQALLRKGDPHLALPPVMALLPEDSYDKPGAVCYPQTPEILIDRQRFANAPQFGNPSTDLHYEDADRNHQDGDIYLSGFWHATREAVASGGNDGYLALRYHAVQVVGVMAPDNASTRVNVTQDGKPLEHADAGRDIAYDASGMSYVNVDAPRAYDLVMNARFGQHELRLSPQHHGLAIYGIAFESCEAGAGK
jgi:thiol-disulfide isomerase/thioredoxin